MAKTDPIEIPVSIDWDAAVKGFEAMARMFAGYASSAQSCADALRTIAKVTQEQS